MHCIVAYLDRGFDAQFDVFVAET